MGVRSTTVTASLALLLCVSLTSCTADGATEEEVDAALLELELAADALSVTILRPGAERAFARKGHPVAAPLTCTAVSGDEPSEELAQGEENSVTAGGTEAEQDPVADDTDADGSREDGPGEDTREERGGRLAVLCTGHSRDGEELRFEGQLLREALAGREVGDDSLRGAFTGLVGEEEVFTMNCFQCSPVNAEPTEPESPEGQDDEPSEPTPDTD
ncbi:hypothetical protein NE857_17680 [Nocardiopsis exhalans]|uniref:Lipoprotein n=1 Tax=Nocardiopsis exhalans TaxID=163604 RepID=A0ABY5D191_9ACTN|nr:hypothetical protein [Nocardiopsis exhalans]USY17185.1 hypothetical protein NE857_17680 [Nocardiopsis exhalans]